MAKYRRKPVIVDAIQYDGDNVDELIEFAGDRLLLDFLPQSKAPCLDSVDGTRVILGGDWIIKHDGSLYYMNDETFKVLYEKCIYLVEQ